jgi:hypothetical protein
MFLIDSLFFLVDTVENIVTAMFVSRYYIRGHNILHSLFRQLIQSLPVDRIIDRLVFE